MLGGTLRQLTLATAIGTGISGGVFFSFSTFVMPALRQLPASQGIAAMQAINLKAPNALFMAALFGSALACGVIALSALGRLDGPTGRYQLLGAAIYLLGSIALTVAYHIPLNNALATVDPNAAEAAPLWAEYAKNWTFWNHVRTVAGIGGSALLTLAWHTA